MEMKLTDKEKRIMMEAIDNSQRFLLFMSEKCDCRKYIKQIEEQEKIKQKLYGIQETE